MFSVLPSRLFSRLGAVVAPSTVARQLAPPSTTFSRVFFAPTTRRTLFTSAARLLAAPAVGTPAVGKPAPKKPAPRVKAAPKPKPKPKVAAKPKPKVAAKPKPKAKAKAAAKPKPKPKKKAAKKKPVIKKKKKVVKKKVVPKKKKRVVKKVAPKPLRITKAMGPPPHGGSPYTQFFRENMKHQTGPVSDRMRTVAAAWKNLSAAEKEPYVVASAEVCAAANLARDKYFAEVDPLLLHRINLQRASKKLAPFRNPHTDKRPLTGFFRFSAAHRQTMPSGTSINEAARACGAAWRAMSDAEKEIYNGPARADMEAYKATHSTVTQLLKEERKAARDAATTAAAAARDAATTAAAAAEAAKA